MPIELKQIWNIPNPQHYKVHFARWNKTDQPLDVWVRDRSEWRGWQEYRPVRDDFNREFIFALASFYHEPNLWLFGGVYRVTERHQDRYEVELTSQGESLAGRLLLGSSYKDRATRVNFENHYSNLEVVEILREPYAGRSFLGFESINMSFGELETIVRRSSQEWRAPLASVKGVYLITDAETGKRYVGSAYGDGGVWERWCEYAETGHGGNVELKTLVSDPTLEYCRRAFRFALLETRPIGVSNELIVSRESYWKNVLFSRGRDGLNRN